MIDTIFRERSALIKNHLFLLCPNNSGSTYLSKAIAQSASVWSLEREGQNMVGFAGPSSSQCPWPLMWGTSEESTAYFRNSPDYDWERTEKAWYYHATSKHDDAPVFFTRSPPFLLIAEQLTAHFRNTRFLFLVRNPYAALEGIIRRRSLTTEISDGTDLPLMAARHLVTCFAAQKANIAAYPDQSISFRYEDLCADPSAIAGQIAALVPELRDLDLSQKLPVKGTYDEPLRNMNDDQIGRLSSDEIHMANSIFRDHADLLSHFDYQIIDA